MIFLSILFIYVYMQCEHAQYTDENIENCSINGSTDTAYQLRNVLFTFHSKWSGTRIYTSGNTTTLLFNFDSNDFSNVCRRRR